MFNVLINPRQTFTGGERHVASHTVVALSVLLISLSTLYVSYFFLVDFDWLKNHLVLQLSPNRRAIAVEILSPRILAISAAAGQVMKTTAWILLCSFYFNVIGRVYRVDRNYMDWIYFTSASYLPLILMLPLGVAAVMLTQGSRLLPDQLDTTSINFLTPGLCSQRWAGICSRISILQLWPLAIQAIGLTAWLNIGAKRALIFAAAPSMMLLAASLLIVLSH